MDHSSIFKTPTRCSSFDGVRSTSITPRGTPRTLTPRQNPTLLYTPRSAAKRTPGDRFIPSRAGADLQFSAYKVRSGMRCGNSGKSPAKNRGDADDLDRTPLVSDHDSAQRKEKLFGLRGRSCDSRILNIRQTSTSAFAQRQNNGQLLPGFYKHLYARNLTLALCVCLYSYRIILERLQWFYHAFHC